MRFREVAAAGLIALLLMPAIAMAQEQELEPPIPMPRPDREAVMAGENGSGGNGESGDETGTGDFPEPGPETADFVSPNVPTDIVSGPPQPVTLSARITEGGSIIPDGLIWRIFDTKTDETGQLAMLAKSDDATAAFSLPPGDYVVHVAYGRSQASDTLSVEMGPNTKSVVLDAGALQLHSAITGDIAIPAGLVQFDIYTAAGSIDERALVVQNARSGDLVHLNAGTYNVVSHFGDVNAVVRADLRVDPGQITDATLYHRAGQITFKLVSEPGGEAIADVEWTVKTENGETVFTDVGAFPAAVLAEGDYTVLAKAGERVFNRDFEVQPSQPREIEVLTQVY